MLSMWIGFYKCVVEYDGSFKGMKVCDWGDCVDGFGRVCWVGLYILFLVYMFMYIVNVVRYIIFLKFNILIFDSVILVL